MRLNIQLALALASICAGCGLRHWQRLCAARVCSRVSATERALRLCPGLCSLRLPQLLTLWLCASILSAGPISGVGVRVFRWRRPSRSRAGRMARAPRIRPRAPGRISSASSRSQSAAAGCTRTPSRVPSCSSRGGAECTTGGREYGRSQQTWVSCQPPSLTA
jgi:hypothetical protein